jgi:hypothetical protein
MTKQERLLGQTILDFANAENTDEACFEHFENIQNIMKFSPNFQERAKKFYPFYAMPGPPPKPVKEDYDELSCEEAELIKRLEDKLTPPFKLVWTDRYYFLLGFSCTFFESPPQPGETTRTVRWRKYSRDPLDVALAGAQHKKILDEIFMKDRVNRTTPEGLLQIRREHEETQWEGMTEGLEKHSPNKRLEFGVDINDHERLAAIYDEQSARDDIARLKGLWDKLNTIYVAIEIAELRHQLKDLLQEIVSGRRYDDIPGIEIYASIYNNLPREKVIVREFELGQISQVNEEDYLEIRWPKEWITRFQKDIAYCLVEFLNSDENRNYIGKCLNCEKHYIKTRLDMKNPQKFCRYNGDDCRTAYNNRRRIESGEAAEYKRKKRKKGAKPSYYG